MDGFCVMKLPDDVVIYLKDHILEMSSKYMVGSTLSGAKLVDELAG